MLFNVIARARGQCPILRAAISRSFDAINFYARGLGSRSRALQTDEPEIADFIRSQQTWLPLDSGTKWHPHQVAHTFISMLRYAQGCEELSSNELSSRSSPLFCELELN